MRNYEVSCLLGPVEFLSTDKDDETKEQLLFAISTAENINGQSKVDYIGKKMESFYGGSWSVHSYTGQRDSWVWLTTGFYASFKYDGKEWFVYRNKC